MKIRLNQSFATLTCFTAALLTGCSKPVDFTLNNMKPGLTLAEAKAVVPSGTVLYCRGDGDAALDQKSMLPQSTKDALCLLASSDGAGGLDISHTTIGSTTSFREQIDFSPSPDGEFRLRSYMLTMPYASYDDMVHTLSATLGRPGDPESDSMGIMDTKVRWKVAGGVVIAGKAQGYGMPSESFVIFEVPPPPPPAQG